MADELRPRPPDLYQGLGMRYWLTKWLPDPPPEALTDLVIAHVHDLAGAIEDEALRERLQQSSAELLKERFGQV